MSAPVGKKCTHVVRTPLYYAGKGPREYSTERREVTLLAVAGAWAMVRRPGAMPYVAAVRELEATP